MTAKLFSSHGFVTNLTDMEKSLSLSGGDFLCQCTIGNLAWFIKVETNEDYFSKECATNVRYKLLTNGSMPFHFTMICEMIKKLP